MLQRTRAYAQSHPFEAWMIEIAAMSVFYGVAYFLVPGLQNPRMIFLFGSLALFSPSFRLIRRSSCDVNEEDALPFRAQQKFGITSIGLSILGLGCIATMMLAKRFGIPVAVNFGLVLLFIYAFSNLLAMKLGYVARRTVPGKIGMLIPVLGIACLLVFKLVLFVT